MNSSFGKVTVINYLAFFAAIVVAIFVALPCFAAGKASSEGAMGLGFTMLYTYIPWLVGFALDTAISKMAVKLLRSLMTSTLSMVLGYPTILLAFTALVVPGGSDSMLAWSLASAVLVLGLGTVKIVSYWVVNESFPSKKIALLLYFNAIVMVGAAYATIIMMKKS